MKSKTPLVMMEQLIMLLVFALAAAFCLQAFALSDSLSEQNALRDAAVTEAQSAAEVIKHCGGDFSLAAEVLGAECEDGELIKSGEGYILTATHTDSGNELLGRAEILVADDSGEELFSLCCAWQRGGADNE